MNLATGVFRINNLDVSKRDERSGLYSTAIKADVVEIRIPLGRLVRKSFDGVINIINPEIVAATVLESPEEKLKKKESPYPAVISPLKTALEKLPYLKLNVNIVNGHLRYINHTANPKMVVTCSSINVQVKHLSNQPQFECNR